MNERDIFLAALEIAEPHQRAAYIDQACGADAQLRSEVQALLSAHERGPEFLETPAVAEDIAATRTLVGEASELMDDVSRPESGEAEFRHYLQPASRPGWLGKLAHYEIESILGRGAFGIVAKAFDEKLHRVVAIKLMNPELAATSPPRKRFIREARTAAAVRHENIVGIYAVEEEPIPYLVMEFIPGQTLQQRLDENGPLGVLDLLRIGQQVAAGLAAAHAVNLIHRDIKPSNILLENDLGSRAKISDFGLARAIDDASLTSSGLIAGTPMYMAPEQARGEVLDHRTDLFSLGSVLYQLVSGRPPFRAPNTVAVLKRVCEDIPRPIGEIIPGTPPWLCAIIDRLLQKAPKDRFQSAQEVVDLLARCQNELQLNGKVTCVQGLPGALASAATAVEHPKHVDHTQRRTRWLVPGAIAVCVLGGLLLRYDRGLLTRAKSAQPVPDPSVATTQPDTSPTQAATTAALGWQGWPADAPPPAVAPFDAQQAQQHQAAWAKYLGVPVEHTNSIGMKFSLIPPGEYTRGSTEQEIQDTIQLITELGYRNMEELVQSEAPLHKVILTQPIYLGQTEVTQDQYQQIMGRTQFYFAAMGGGKESVVGLETGHFPADSVTWFNAAEFCTKLSQLEKLKPFYYRSALERIILLEGTGYRLPLDAEWEFACRAGTTTRYWSGDSESDLASVGFYNMNSGLRVHAVKKLRPNPYGLYDMQGNVAEWVQELWRSMTYQECVEVGAVDPGSPFSRNASPKSPDDEWVDQPSRKRVLRGGGVYNGPPVHRAGHRSNGYPSDGDRSFGMRVVLDIAGVRRANP